MDKQKIKELKEEPPVYKSDFLKELEIAVKDYFNVDKTYLSGYSLYIKLLNGQIFELYITEKK